MKYRFLGKTGLSISEIGYGTWGLGGDSYGPISDETSIECLRRAYELGVNFFDTSDLYGAGHSEEVIGRAFRADREKVILATKVGLLPHTGFYMPQDLSPEYIGRALEASLRRLNTDYVDLYQLHSPEVAYLREHPEVFDALDELCVSQKVRNIGLSARSPLDAMDLLKLYPFASVQVNFNLIDHRGVDDGLFSLAKKEKIGIIARTPLCFGYLTGKLSGKKDFKGQDHRANWPEDQLNRWANAPGLFDKLLQKKAYLPSQLALSFCLQPEAVSTTVPGMMKLIEVEQNTACSDLPRLSNDDIQEIKRIYLSNTFFDKTAKNRGKQ
jgi:aryl-alcohol dehydrogenase-like predicted oxidoreductase